MCREIDVISCGVLGCGKTICYLSANFPGIFFLLRTLEISNWLSIKRWEAQFLTASHSFPKPAHFCALGAQKCLPTGRWEVKWNHHILCFAPFFPTSIQVTTVHENGQVESFMIVRFLGYGGKKGIGNWWVGIGMKCKFFCLNRRFVRLRRWRRLWVVWTKIYRI